jgi:hypothetical protein
MRRRAANHAASTLDEHGWGRSNILAARRGSTKGQHSAQQLGRNRHRRPRTSARWSEAPPAASPSCRLAAVALRRASASIGSTQGSLRMCMQRGLHHMAACVVRHADTVAPLAKRHSLAQLQASVGMPCHQNNRRKLLCSCWATTSWILCMRLPRLPHEAPCRHSESINPRSAEPRPSWLRYPGEDSSSCQMKVRKTEEADTSGK